MATVEKVGVYCRLSDEDRDKLNKIIVDEFIDTIYIGNYDKETNSRDIEILWNIEF